MVVVHYTIESYWIYRKDTLDKLDHTGYWKDTQEGILWEVHTGPSGYWKVSLLLYSLLKYAKLVLTIIVSFSKIIVIKLAYSDRKCGIIAYFHFNMVFLIRHTPLIFWNFAIFFYQSLLFCLTSLNHLVLKFSVAFNNFHLSIC